MKINSKEQELITILRDNGRASVTDLASALGVSRATVQKRLDRLEADGIIAGYTVRLSSAFLAQEIKANVSVVVKPRKADDIIIALKKSDAVRAVYSVSGPYDLIIQIAAHTVGELDKVIDNIIAIEGVERTETSIILSTRLER